MENGIATLVFRKPGSTTADGTRHEDGRTAIGNTLLPSVALAVLFAIGMLIRGWQHDIAFTLDDPDSVMRLVEVRDWIAGQGWFDLTQYRLAPPEGVFMHWSRLVDAPIALLMSAFTPFAGSAAAETIAVNLWPVLTLVLFLVATAMMARTLAGQGAGLLAIGLLLASPAVLLIFTPGRIDHHNLQSALMMLMTAQICSIRNGWRPGLVAGIAAAASLAIGMEMLVVVVVGAAALGIDWTREGERVRSGVVAYGLGFAAATAAFFLATVAPDRWMLPACDAISPVYLTLAMVGGLGIAALAGVLTGDRRDGAAGYLLRGAGLVGLGFLLVTIVAAYFPACLGGPYAGLDPRLGPIWMDEVSEAQNVFQVFAKGPAFVVLYYGPALAVLAGIAWVWRRLPEDERAIWLKPAAMLVLMWFVACWQVRAAVPLGALSIPLAAALLFKLLDRSLPSRRRIAGAVLFAAMQPLVLFVVMANFGKVGQLNASDDQTILACKQDLSGVLAREAGGLVVAPWTLGVPILATTGDSVLSAPYHRGGAGIIAADQIMTGTAKSAEGIMAAEGARYVAFCAGEPGSRKVMERAPEGLLAVLAAGRTPSWLEPLPSEGPARVFAMRPVPEVAEPEVTGSTNPLPDKEGPGLRPTFAPFGG
ncbi:oligosaccharyl transferase, archaeosortase A system-associated [Hartmannibacter diazotrophicus]|uniref:Oligosaccharyl transferase, archaeosortase A system-associated n=1 Tax=Hartmannibacter diazotrophicus TaxID=1482074 RepID=A0A2C9D1W4_9HYPH|nr:hypothetical protein [Hartmannibacter diazotrophicus]SON54138.1 oligosaccharyl transferase, archaeosortase A system-associated [Hartmannibacter diazotrophicus]